MIDFELPWDSLVCALAALLLAIAFTFALFTGHIGYMTIFFVLSIAYGIVSWVIYENESY